MTWSKVARLFTFSHTTALLPLASHPIWVRQLDDLLWQLQEYRPAHVDKTWVAPGQLITNNLTEVSPVALNLVSDGSVHLAQRVVTCTWVVHQQDGSQLQACVHLEPMTSISSYRSKLEGMYRGLCMLRHLGITAAILRQWCYSTAAVDGCNKQFLGPTALVAPDADVLLAIRFLLRQLGRTKVIAGISAGIKTQKARHQLLH